MAKKSQYTCESCGVTFKAKSISDEGLSILFCPCCGEDLERESDDYNAEIYNVNDDDDE